MSSKRPRIAPLPESEWTDEAREVFAVSEGRSGNAIGSRGNIALTLARHPKLGKSYLRFGLRLLWSSALPDRLREIVTLRVAHLCRSAYEWKAHVKLGKEAGLTDEHVEATKIGAESPLWSEVERFALTGVDELHRDKNMTDGTWNVLAKHLDERQLLDFLFTVGGYTMLSMFLNTVGIEVEKT